MKKNNCNWKGKNVSSRLGDFLVGPKKQKNRWIEINVTIVNNFGTKNLKEKFTKIFN